jgi:AcrR family transcriptional regulator
MAPKPPRGASATRARTKRQPRGGEERRRTQEERSEATRRALIAAARRLFAERGYAAVGTEEIVHAAGVTRGALYHHFEDKAALLEAVYEQIEEELTQEIAAGAMSNPDPVAALKLGAAAFLDHCLEPEVQRIVLLDAPAVLGWERWREIGAQHGLGLVEAGLAGAMEQGAISRQPVRPLAHVLMGALDEAAMTVARADNPRAARREMEAILATVLDGLRINPQGAGA